MGYMQPPTPIAIRWGWLVPHPCKLYEWRIPSAHTFNYLENSYHLLALPLSSLLGRAVYSTVALNPKDHRILRVLRRTDRYHNCDSVFSGRHKVFLLSLKPWLAIRTAVGREWLLWFNYHLTCLTTFTRSLFYINLVQWWILRFFSGHLNPIISSVVYLGLHQTAIHLRWGNTFR